MSLGEKIRIDDLRNPVLTDIQKGALAFGEASPVELTIDAVLSRAVENTGLEDFGPTDFHERLSLWLSETDENPERTAMGRLILFNDCVRSASNRLRIRDLLKRHPEIHDVEILRPIIVIGLPRSGTTHLVNLLAADQRLRSLPLWESQQPVPDPNEAPGPDGADARWTRSEAAWQGFRSSAPLIATMHPMNPDHIHEELELQLPDFTSYNQDWVTRAPKCAPPVRYSKPTVRFSRTGSAKRGIEAVFWIGFSRRRTTGILAIALFVAGCAVVMPPSTAELNQVGRGETAVVLIRFVGEDSEGRPFETFGGALSDDNIGLAIGNFETGGLPTQRLDWVRFLSEESRRKGWIYLVLAPGTHYLAVQASRQTDGFIYAAQFKTAPRWRVEVPSGAAVVYAGTLDLRGTTMELLFGGRHMVAIDGDNSAVRDESALAGAIAAANLGGLGPPQTSLMTRHTGPLILTTPPAEAE